MSIVIGFVMVVTIMIWRSWLVRIPASLVLLVILYYGFVSLSEVATTSYLHYRCEKDGGVTIHRTVEGVEGILIKRPREQRDIVSAMRFGDLMEDPYHFSDVESAEPGTLFLNPLAPHYDFVELPVQGEVTAGQQPGRVTRLTPLAEQYERNRYVPVSSVEADAKSRYGYSWEGSRTLIDRVMRLWGGELRIYEIQTGEILASSRGFLTRNWLAGLIETCPGGRSTAWPSDFVASVLVPANQKYSEETYR